MNKMYAPLIITSSDFSTHQSIFSLNDPFKELIFTIPDEEEPIVFKKPTPTLPAMLVEKIIVYTMMLKLKQLDFHEAASICTLSKHICTQVYRSIYPESYQSILFQSGLSGYKINVTAIAARVFRTFFLVEHTLLVHCQRCSESDTPFINFIQAEVVTKPCWAKRFYPWDVLGNIEIGRKWVSTVKMITPPGAKYIRFGDRIMDAAFIAGKDLDGITHPSYLKTPVITFAFTDPRRNVRPTKRLVENDPIWKRFNNLFRYILGARVGLYYFVQNNEEIPHEYVFEGHSLILVDGN